MDEQKIKRAIRIMLDSGKDLTRDGKPEVAALASICGFQISAAERNYWLDFVQEELALEEVEREREAERERERRAEEAAAKPSRYTHSPSLVDRMRKS